MKTTMTLISLTAAVLFLNVARAEDSADDVEPTNYCVSADPALGDTAYWAISAVKLFSEEKYAEAVEAVDACFPEWGPAGGHQQKALHDEGAKCPKTGKVSQKTKQKIDANGLLNDVSMALWAKARSLHKLDRMDEAKQAYAQCIYMTCGRAWDPNGWFWSPAEDCAKYGRELVD
jgi:hypothetical protein